MRWLSRKLATVPLDPPEQIVVLGPYDQLILQTERRVPRDVMARLKAQLNEQNTSEAKVLILEGGLKLVAVRQREPIKRSADDLDVHGLPLTDPT